MAISQDRIEIQELVQKKKKVKAVVKRFKEVNMFSITHTIALHIVSHHAFYEINK